MILNYINPRDHNSGVRNAVEELILSRRMAMENIRNLLEELAIGIKEIKTSQYDMKIRFTNEIKSVQK